MVSLTGSAQQSMPVELGAGDLLKNLRFERPATSPYPSVIYSPVGSPLRRKLENPACSWNNGGRNTSSPSQDKGAFE
jgi:hypothetical protein